MIGANECPAIGGAGHEYEIDGRRLQESGELTRVRLDLKKDQAELRVLAGQANQHHVLGHGVNQDVPLRGAYICLLQHAVHQLVGNPLTDTEDGCRHTSDQFLVDFTVKQGCDNKTIRIDQGRARDIRGRVTEVIENGLYFLYARRC